jgi:hypothetical protein
VEVYGVCGLPLCFAFCQKWPADIHYSSNRIPLVWDQGVRQQGKGPVQI